ncbi:hypothetical protein PVAP13_7KG327123 [Panicum virgatum]|uniref:KIB1-4 beta-propeller domain-containing protein n=1 Tax=Panicum virgatum TaxID=38727 RepID=A0A8T0QMU5_PANVG|nr:hypothetical protein PVAP13_7KG327123 [Panicum virgatum]
MAPVEHASDELRSIEDEGKNSMSPCLPLIVFQHQSCQHKNEHEMLMFSVSQKHLLLHAAADIAPDLVTGNMFWTSPQGWMLVIKSTRFPSSSSAAWLWNPRTGDRITLPDVERDGDDDIDIPLDCKCLLTHKDATHPECIVVLFDRTEPNMWYCKVVDDGRRSWWRHYTYDIGDYEYEVPGKDPPSPTKRVISSIAAVQGELFFISSHQDMCAISFTSASDDPEFQYFHYWNPTVSLELFSFPMKI